MNNAHIWLDVPILLAGLVISVQSPHSDLRGQSTDGKRVSGTWDRDGDSRRGIKISPHTSLDDAFPNNHIHLVPRVELFPIYFFSITLSDAEEE
jgi:hypothetical protein